MQSIAGYQIIEKLYESATTLVYRGHRETDDYPVILKLLKEAYPSPELIAWFKREYEITHELNLLRDTGSYTFESDQHQWIIVLEDFGGESLKRLDLAGKINLTSFLELSIEVADCLGYIHQQNVMHKDINPANIVFNPKTGQVRIIDFGISTVLSRENPTFRNPNVLEGTLPYMSPEQTGRMNRAMDYRTDFYSLGVTFYELLTGQLPFTSQEPLEIVHSHIARQPVPPHERRKDIPPIISSIILKLMSKNAEDRYQTGHGLKADLELCLQKWQTTGHIAPFELGQHDVSDRFLIPQKLYGRESEIETLLAVFERVASYGNVGNHRSISPVNSEMVLVAGYAGIGKTALVQEIYKPITRQRGYFISGKFDQLQRDTPYSAFIQAFRSLILNLLTESEEEIAVWRENLITAVGPNIQVVIEVIPEVEMIVGVQPEVVSLSPMESQNRFNLVFQQFIRAFCQPDHPLVIFLDDLQWSDNASLKLIDVLMTTTGEIQHALPLLIIGAYRDNEVAAGHPLRILIESIEQADIMIYTLSLAPLDVDSVCALMVDTLHCTDEEVRPLAQLVHTKTGGNPFFLNEFLKSLYVEELIVFNYKKQRWEWDINHMHTLDITDNVVELMSSKVKRLDKKTQSILKFAACIGKQFDLGIVSLLSQQTPGRTALDLGHALQEGLLVPLGESYKLMSIDIPGLAEVVTAEYQFAHDRVRQAVYSLIPRDEQEKIHWHLGQLLLEHIPVDKQEERIFDIVNHLNEGLQFLRRDDAARCLYEKWDQLIELNLLAGKKARSSAAYTAAFNYLKVALSLLEEDNWQWQYGLTLELYVEAAEAAYLSGHLQDMELLASQVLKRAKNVLDKVRVYEVTIRGYVAQNKQNEAVDMAIQVLKLLDVEFPEKPDLSDIIFGLQDIIVALGGKRINESIDLTEMKDPYKLAVMHILATVADAAYITVPELFALMVLKMISVSVHYGNAPVSAPAYGLYGLVLCGFLGDIDSGYQSCKTAMGLLDWFNAQEFKSRTHFFYNGFVRHWKEHARETLAPLLEVYQNGLETGDLGYAANALLTYCQYAYFIGKELGSLEQEITSYKEVLGRLKQQRTMEMIGIYHQAVLNLRGQAKGRPYRLIGDSYNEKKKLPLYLEANDGNAIYYVCLNKLILCYLFHEYDEAIQYATMAEKYTRTALGTMSIALFYFYDCLARLGGFHLEQKPEQDRILERVSSTLEKMKQWAQHAPMNHLHKFYILKAEQSRALGNDRDAWEFYDLAIDLAQDHEHIHEEALACELAATSYIIRKRTRIAHVYLRDAHYAYQRWGATEKATDLEERYPEVFEQFDMSRSDITKTRTTTTRTTTTGHMSSNILDLPSVIKASQAISGEIVLESLLTKMMRVVVENAGAERGVLILEKDKKWVVEAESTIEQSPVEQPEVTVLQSIPIEAHGRAPLPKTIINYVARTRRSIVLNDAVRQGEFTRDAYVIIHQPRSVLCMPLSYQGKLIGMLYLENKLTTGAFTADRLEILNMLSSQIAISIENARLYSNLEVSLNYQVALTSAYSRFVPREILKFLGKESIIQVALGDQSQQEMTVLFSDIRDFTTLSEQMTPQENFNFINSYLGRVSPIIREHNGFIDKYIGDAIMALFPGKADDAVQAAIEIQQEVTTYNEQREKAGYKPIRIGVGIHTGNVMLGTVGEEERMEGTVISDTVNLASRLEGLTKLYGVLIIISEGTLFKLDHPENYDFYFLDQVKVKGKKDPVSVFEILDGYTEEVIESKRKTRGDFEQGLFHYHSAEYQESLSYFKHVLSIEPDDRAAQLYLKRATYCIEYGLPVDWEETEGLR